MNTFGTMVAGWFIISLFLVFFMLGWIIFFEWVNRSREKRASRMLEKETTDLAILEIRKAEQLGERTYFTMVAFKLESMIETECQKLVDAIIKEIGMEIAYPPKSYSYPLIKKSGKEGKGGKGFTYFQTITDSFIAVDYWKDLKGGYLTVCSCKKYNSAGILKVMRRNDMVRILKIFTDNIGIKNGL